MEFREPAMRPPQEAHSLLLRATQGCTYNACHFCYVSRGYPFAAVTPEDLEREVAAQAPFFPPDTSIYLTGSNPFALPTSTLRAYIDVLRRHVPHCKAISLQSRVDDISPKSDEELRDLRDRGLSHLYIGVENGNDDVLTLMNKGYTAEQAAHELTRLDQAHITYTTFYVLGLGGAGKGRACAEATADLLNRLHPTRITTTGMTIFPHTPLADMVRRGIYREASEREKIEELYVFLERLSIDTFYDGIHYLNPLNYRLHTADPMAKQRVLADIQEVLEHSTDDELELMVSRARMHSL